MSERDYFSAKINDLISRFENGEELVFSSFLTAEEAITADRLCSKYHMPHIFCGGYAECERKILAISFLEESQIEEQCPIVLIKIESTDLSLLSNRDVLGALMGSGIRRELLGDIIIRNGVAVFFALEQIAEFLIQNVSLMGKVKVRLSIVEDRFPIPPAAFEHQRMTVASLRLDAVVSGVAHISREQASELIENKMVQINHIPSEKKTKEIRAGDCLVIRGFGKWMIDECGELSRKGRIVLRCRKYI